MMAATPLFAVLVAIAVALSTNLAGLLIISTVFHAASVVNVHMGPPNAQGLTPAYGVTPYLALALLAGILWALRILNTRRLDIPAQVRLPMYFLGAYLVVAWLGAWFLPRWFEGLPVNLLVQRDGIGRLSDLGPSIANIVQPINLLVHALVLLFFLQSTDGDDHKVRLVVGALWALGLTVGIGLYQQWATTKGLPGWAPLLANNPGYEQAPVAEKQLWFRIGLPFSEPSYASACLAATTVGCWAVVLLGLRWWWVWLLAACSSVGLLNTLGATGLAAAAAAMTLLWVWVMINALRLDAPWTRRWRAAALGVVLLLASSWGYQAYSVSPLKPKVSETVNNLIIGKAKLQDGVRESSNKRALEIVKETNGLGVGMGSNRASSFFASLLSNTGVLGFVLFMGMLGTLLWRYWQAPRLSDMQIFVAAALPTATLAMGLGIPDLNMPMYWGFIFLGFVFCPALPSKDQKPDAH
jgi:hypothetical protein